MSKSEHEAVLGASNEYWDSCSLSLARTQSFLCGCSHVVKLLEFHPSSWELALNWMLSFYFMIIAWLGISITMKIATVTSGHIVSNSCCQVGKAFRCGASQMTVE